MAWQDRDYYRQEASPMIGRMSGMSVVLWLLIINAAVWFWDTIMSASGGGRWLALKPVGEFSVDLGFRHYQFWRLVTYQFLHAGFLHIFFNLYGLYLFGPQVEAWLGPRRFLAFYLLCGMCGAVVFSGMTLVPGLGIGDAPLVGASGAIYGVLAACAVIAPRQPVMLLFPPIPMTMRTMVLAYLALAALVVITSSANAGGEAAHLGGALLGFVLIKSSRSLAWVDGLSWKRRHSARAGRWQRKMEAMRKAEEAEQAEVDRILDKVRQHGLQSLTRGEKKALQRATERQRREE